MPHPLMPSFTVQECRDAFLAVLRAERLAVTIDADGDLRLRAQPYTFFILFDASDPSFVRVVYPNFYQVIDHPDDLPRAYRALNTVNNRIKLAKVSLQKDPEGRGFNASTSVEMIVQDLSTIVRPYLVRVIALLESAAKAYVHELVNGD